MININMDSERYSNIDDDDDDDDGGDDDDNDDSDDDDDDDDDHDDNDDDDDVDGSDRHETLGKRVSNHSRHFNFRRPQTK